MKLKEHAKAMLARSSRVAALAVAVSTSAAMATTWEVWPTEKDGMTPSQQLTNAVTRAANNLRLREGRLDPGCFECWLNITGTRVIFR